MMLSDGFIMKNYNMFVSVGVMV